LSCLVLLWSPPEPKTHTLPLKTSTDVHTNKVTSKQTDRHRIFRTCSSFLLQNMLNFAELCSGYN
jgi:hypothetical protein